ncbi:MAG: GNAT family N-acetyltransferase [Elainella sp. Prado103]|jgi:hypothetical protein|nr:GNAT family N-acetyltransferase [Elainella sp. Prado103]
MNVQIIDLFDPLWMEILRDLPHDFYHLPSYVGLEADRNKAVAEAILIQEGGQQFFLPYLLRQCSDLFPGEVGLSNWADVISPYGYPGVLWNRDLEGEFIQLAMDQMVQTFQERQICSAFLRLHPILNRDWDQFYSSPSCRLHSQTIAVDLTLTEVEIWQQTRPEHRNKINKCKRAGLTATLNSTDRYLDDFIDIYRETMDRVGASASYYFSHNYFEQLFAALGDKIHIGVVELDHQIICAGLFTECQGIVQYHLGGTRSQFLKRSPSTFLFDYVRYWAKQRGNTVFHLGGGVGGSQDSLYHFKAGFSQQRYDFRLMRLVIDPEQYDYLVELRARKLNAQTAQLLQMDYFPVYRLLNTG